MARAIFSAVLAVGLIGLSSSCMVHDTVQNLEAVSPPPAHGRAGWVRTGAAAGGWAGGLIGGAFAIIILPITYPISLIAADDFQAHSQREFLLFPAVTGTGFGHFVIGAPLDGLDYVFRRMWVSEKPAENGFELVPMGPPAEPAAPFVDTADPQPDQPPETDPSKADPGSEKGG